MSEISLQNAHADARRQAISDTCSSVVGGHALATAHSRELSAGLCSRTRVRLLTVVGVKSRFSVVTFSNQVG